MLTPEQIQEARTKYGVTPAPPQAVSNRVAEMQKAWNQQTPSATPIVKASNLGELSAKETLAGAEKSASSVVKAAEKFNKAPGVVEKTGALLEGALGFTSGAVQSIFAPITATVQKVSQIASDNPEFQSFAQSISPILDAANDITHPLNKWAEENPEIATNLMDAFNVALTAIGGGKADPILSAKMGTGAKIYGGVGSDVVSGAKTVGTKIGDTTRGITKGIGEIKTKAEQIGGGIKSDILPTGNRIVNSEITRALDLTQSDVKNISLSTGNDVGEFIARENLIGSSAADTAANLDAFYKKNYDAVRAETQKVHTVYEPTQVPRYTEALTEIKKQIQDVPGLQAVNTEIDDLLRKPELSLNNVQRVKELMDEHFQLYKVTGDVKAGVAKEGLTNIRKYLRSFIETEVKKTTGADIRLMNNNVSTSRSISDAIETRSTRGLTRANISPTDFMTFLTGSALGTPVAGILAVVLKKIYQSPSFKLKVAKWIDGLSDAEKARIQNEVKNGVVPEEIQSLQADDSVPPNRKPKTPIKPKTSERSNFI